MVHQISDFKRALRARKPALHRLLASRPKITLLSHCLPYQAHRRASCRHHDLLPQFPVEAGRVPLSPTTNSTQAYEEVVRGVLTQNRSTERRQGASRGRRPRRRVRKSRATQHCPQIEDEASWDDIFGASRTVSQSSTSAVDALRTPRRRSWVGAGGLTAAAVCRSDYVPWPEA